MILLFCFLQFTFGDVLQSIARQETRECTESSTLSDLREELVKSNLAGYIIPSEQGSENMQ